MANPVPTFSTVAAADQKWSSRVVLGVETDWTTLRQCSSVQKTRLAYEEPLRISPSGLLPPRWKTFESVRTGLRLVQSVEQTRQQLFNVAQSGQVQGDVDPRRLRWVGVSSSLKMGVHSEWFQPPGVWDEVFQWFLKFTVGKTRNVGKWLSMALTVAQMVTKAPLSEHRSSMMLFVQCLEKAYY